MMRSSPIAFVAGFLRRVTGAGDARPDIEILPPDHRNAKPEWDLNLSVEERADAFASLFLNASPKDMRPPRMGNLKEQ